MATQPCAFIRSVMNTVHIDMIAIANNFFITVVLMFFMQVFYLLIKVVGVQECDATGDAQSVAVCYIIFLNSFSYAACLQQGLLLFFHIQCLLCMNCENEGLHRNEPSCFLLLLREKI